MSRLAVDKFVYLSKVGMSTVEVWDRRNERMVDCIDCAQIIRRHCGARGRGSEKDVPSESSPSWARVKALSVQSAATLWIGTRGGHVILLELNKNQALQVIGPRCSSVRSMSSVFIETLNWKNVVLVLGRRLPRDKSNFDEESVLMVWSSSLPKEVRDLSRLCERRERIAARMREQLQQN